MIFVLSKAREQFMSADFGAPVCNQITELMPRDKHIYCVTLNLFVLNIRDAPREVLTKPQRPSTSSHLLFVHSALLCVLHKRDI